MKKQLYGQITIGFNEFILPLAEAQKLQFLLAEHAVCVDSTYTPNFERVAYLKEPAVSGLSVVNFPKFDIRGLSDTTKAEWLNAIRADDAQSIIDPQHFKTLTE